MGIKYMFATLCSNPDATKAIMGKKMANIFPIVCLAEKAIHTARQTSQLHPIPLANASRNDKFTFALAILRAVAPTK